MIEKGLEQQVVLYWYQSHGRVIANEYRSKIFMVYDAARLNRSDAALVRVTSAKLGSESTFQDAEARAVEFVKALFPSLGSFCRRRTISRRRIDCIVLHAKSAFAFFSATVYSRHPQQTVRPPAELGRLTDNSQKGIRLP